ncbi:MAG: FAD-dependent oxidoreductase [Chloroflexi bacterium]|nr:FAD-dependent oxidoreductase [Chloroflexota bacterium]
MSSQIGTAERPLRVAIIGAGPSGYYAAGALIEQKNIHVSVDIFDRLPTPFGLVRYGVAPDHPKIKSVIRVYEKISLDPRVRFYGNVDFGKDLTHDDARRYYDQIIYAYGSASDRKLGIPGEDLRGAYSATEFVGWYNCHPDFVNMQFDVAAARTAVVVGIGNVAMDVVRVLAKSVDELKTTDIGDHSLDLLKQNKLEHVYLLGRRGPVQAAFTNPELRELGELHISDTLINPADLDLDPASKAAAEGDKEILHNLETLHELLKRGTTGKQRQVHVRFLTSPVELIGSNGHVSALKMERNMLVPGSGGALSAKGTGQFETIPVDIIFRAVGYKGLPVPGVPYDSKSGTVPNEGGRVVDAQSRAVVPGEYVVGWAKRGPSGVIGTNKPDAVETVQLALQDAASLTPVCDEHAKPATFDAFIRGRQPNIVSYDDWKVLDAAETALGKPQGRPRVKYTNVPDMLNVIATNKK